jgi:hypothetical protein
MLPPQFTEHAANGAILLQPKEVSQEANRKCDFNQLIGRAFTMASSVQYAEIKDRVELFSHVPASEWVR